MVYFLLSKLREVTDVKCKECGRELPPGETKCPCSESSNEKQKNDDTTEKVMTPDGRDLASLEKKPAPSKKRVIVLSVILAVVCIAGVILYFALKGPDPLDESTWRKVEKDGYSITLPEALKENDNINEDDPDFEKIGFFVCDTAAVYISKSELNEAEKDLVKKSGVEKIRQDMIKNSKKMKLDNQSMTVKMQGDLVITEYAEVRQQYLKSSEDVWIVTAVLVTEDSIYEIEGCCSRDDKDKYHDAMYKWLESFKPE
jgi:hypothetical protein